MVRGLIDGRKELHSERRKHLVMILFRAVIEVEIEVGNILIGPSYRMCSSTVELSTVFPNPYNEHR